MDWEMLLKLWVVVGLVVVLLGLLRREDARDPDDKTVGFSLEELVVVLVLSTVLWPVLVYSVVLNAFLDQDKE